MPGLVAWSYFLGLTAIFGLQLESILDPWFIRHQAREILTHASVTLPLGLGLLAIIHRSVGAGQGARPDRPSVPRFAGVLAIPAYCGIAVLATDALTTGQSERGLSAMVAAHYFEHSLNFVLIGLLVVGFQAFRLRPHVQRRS
jgi:hypothetical protein